MTSKTEQDRFPGVAEAIAGGGIRIFPRHPDWQGDPRKFDELYILVADVRVPCTGDTPKAEYVGSKAPRICAFCGRSAPTVTFRDEAHTVPAGFGNRHHFTWEECDECNHAFGDKLDHDLANYLAFERVAVGVRKRGSSSIKVKAPDGTYASYNHEVQGIEIVVDSSRPDSRTAVDTSTLGSFEVTIHHPAFSFDAVFRQMARLAWMMMTPEQRAESPEYLPLIRGVTVAGSCRLFRLFAPGARRLVTLRVWRARSEVTDVPKTVVSFCLGPCLNVWTSCDGPTLQHKPGPLPPFEADATFGQPSMQLLELEPGATQDAGPQKMTFGYSQPLHHGPLPKTPIAPKKRPRPRLDVEFCWTRDGREHRLASRVHVQRNDGKSVRLLFAGGDLAAELLVHGHAGPDSADCELDLNLAQQPLDKAMQTVELLEALCNSAGATIHASDGTIWQLAGLQPPADIDLPALRRQLEAFGEVAREFKIMPLVPADADRASWKSIAYLAEAMRTGRVLWRSPVPFGFLLSPAVAEQVDAEILGQPGDIRTQSHREWSINGQPLDVGDLRLVVPDATVSQRIEVVQDGQPMVRYEFANEILCYEFPRWLPQDDSAS